MAQVAGMFDVPLAERQEWSISAPLPSLEENWQIGLIVGPSGSGKSTIAKAAFGDAIYQPGIGWPENQSVLDGFPEEASAREITAMLTSVGFSSPPAWIRPYAVLSGGEKFRCDLARALLNRGDTETQSGRVVVFDEFTSVVDRTVARVGSAAVAKAIRSMNAAADRNVCPTRFVAVTCHYDVAAWLCPDWVLDMESKKLSRRRLRRPELQLEVFRARRAAWELFKPHHYLSQSIPGGAALYVGMLAAGELAPEPVPVGIVVVGNHFGSMGRGILKKRVQQRRISRIVVLPDYQGIGIGSRLLDAVAELVAGAGNPETDSGTIQVGISTSHPGMIAHLKRSDRWRVTQVLPYGREAKRQVTGVRRATAKPLSSSLGRAMVSAVWCG